jgi:oligopeptide transport system substrate-binding protein
MGDRVYVPLRGVLERIGADVKWNPNRRVVVARQGDTVVRLPAGEFATVNGRRVSLDAPAYVENGGTMVPLRFLSETFGAQVRWNAGDREVRISHDGPRQVSFNR